jgi:hypothetical protein
MGVPGVAGVAGRQSYRAGACGASTCETEGLPVAADKAVCRRAEHRISTVPGVHFDLTLVTCRDEALAPVEREAEVFDRHHRRRQV